MKQELVTLYKGSEPFPIGIFSQTSYMPEPHHHIEYEIFYLAKGEAVIGIDNLELKLVSGNVVFINSGSTHYVRRIKEDNEFQYYAFTFDSSVLGNEGEAVRNVFDSIMISRKVNLPEVILNQIVKTLESEQNQVFGRELFEKALLMEIISYIIQTKQYVEVTDKSSNKENLGISVIDVSLKYIHDHYRESITMEDLLKITAYSKSHFIRLFKKYTGMNLTDYINKYRIEKSCLDLLYTSKNITEIATENGFNTVQYFSKIFKSYMNCTPKRYQKEGRKIIIPTVLT